MCVCQLLLKWLYFLHKYMQYALFKNCFKHPVLFSIFTETEKDGWLNSYKARQSYFIMEKGIIIVIHKNQDRQVEE